MAKVNPRHGLKNLPDQSGKVHIITRATSGVGKALSGILYSANAKVYVTGRSKDKGELVYLHLDLSNLSIVKDAAGEFLAKETQLHPRTKQGYEVQLGTNALGPFLFTKLLTPVLLSTAREGKASGSAPRHVQVRIGLVKHSSSKAANNLYSAELARRYQMDSIISIPLDPGNLRTDLHRSSLPFQLAVRVFLHDPIYGAYTELFAGLSPEVKMEMHNAFRLRKDIEDACKTTEEGGTGISQAFWEWPEKQVEGYVPDRKITASL
ncbi:retinol dehydrogenase 12 [Xylariaceae sp. FL1651]|nr:retinol dehydrogenase 12 [Xylariaceae sp. FL1651]